MPQVVMFVDCCCHMRALACVGCRTVSCAVGRVRPVSGHLPGTKLVCIQQLLCVGLCCVVFVCRAVCEFMMCLDSTALSNSEDGCTQPSNSEQGHGQQTLYSSLRYLVFQLAFTFSRRFRPASWRPSIRTQPGGLFVSQPVNRSPCYSCNQLAECAACWPKGGPNSAALG
jgi:hypothetical protein